MESGEYPALIDEALGIIEDTLLDTELLVEYGNTEIRSEIETPIEQLKFLRDYLLELRQ
jgi:hypothetical protein